MARCLRLVASHMYNAFLTRSLSLSRSLFISPSNPQTQTHTCVCPSVSSLQNCLFSGDLFRVSTTENAIKVGCFVIAPVCAAASSKTMTKIGVRLHHLITPHLQRTSQRLAFSWFTQRGDCDANPRPPPQRQTSSTSNADMFVAGWLTDCLPVMPINKCRRLTGHDSQTSSPGMGILYLFSCSTQV
jgi:hypothetical protein